MLRMVEEIMTLLEHLGFFNRLTVLMRNVKRFFVIWLTVSMRLFWHAFFTSLTVSIHLCWNAWFHYLLPHVATHLESPLCVSMVVVTLWVVYRLGNRAQPLLNYACPCVCNDTSQQCIMDSASCTLVTSFHFSCKHVLYDSTVLYVQLGEVCEILQQCGAIFYFDYSDVINWGKHRFTKCAKLLRFTSWGPHCCLTDSLPPRLPLGKSDS
jgi:hypothetical protein